MAIADCFAHVQAKNHNASTGKTTTTTTAQTNKLGVVKQSFPKRYGVLS